MEMSQVNSVGGYLEQTKNVIYFFFLLQSWATGVFPEEFGTSGRWRRWGKNVGVWI
jgi:hypothetical protein